MPETLEMKDAPPAPDMAQYYCSRCGVVDRYLAKVLAIRKESINCHNCHRPMKPINQLPVDQDLGK